MAMLGERFPAAQFVVTDLTPDNVKHLATEGAIPSSSLDDFAPKLGKPRIAWLMVPAGDATEKTVQQLAQRLQPGDIIIDGGNAIQEYKGAPELYY